jgi:hypothetical protein
MPRALILPALLALSLAFVSTARAASYQMIEIGLYQTNDVLTQRMGNDANSLATYVKALNAAGAAYTDAQHSGIPSVVDIVVAFKPSGATKVWIVDDRKAIAAPGAFAQKLESIHPPKSSNGPVAFSIHVSLWGGNDSNQQNYRPPLPAEWQQAAKSTAAPVPVDDILSTVWKG